MVLEELATSKDLVMPELPWIPLEQLTMDEFTESYYKYFNHNPQAETRSQLQNKITKELVRLRPVMQTYDLVDKSSFGAAADQSDYMKRVRFQDQLLLSEKYDLGKIVNDDVYRTKQRKKMISRLSPFDQSVLYEKGIEIPFRPFDCHPDLQPYFFKHNFSFEK